MKISRTRLRDIFDVDDETFDSFLDEGLGKFQEGSQFLLHDSVQWFTQHCMDRMIDDSTGDINFQFQVKREAEAMARKERLKAERVAGTLVTAALAEEAIVELREVLDEIRAIVPSRVADAIHDLTPDAMRQPALNVIREILTFYSEGNRV